MIEDFLFDRARLAGAGFRRAVLVDCSFIEADSSGADFEDAVLENCVEIASRSNPPSKAITWCPIEDFRIHERTDAGRQVFMALLQIDANADVLRGLKAIEELDLGRAVDDLGAGRYRMSGYAPESLIPELEARGCSVEVLMTTQAVDEFHEQVANTVSPPPDDPTAAG